MQTSHASMLLDNFIHRLEAATSRLEDIATSAANNEPSSNEKFQASAGTAGAVKPQSLDPSTATNVSTTKSAPEIPLIVKKFDEIVDGNLKDWVDQSNKLGGPVAQQVGLKNVIQVLYDANYYTCRLRQCPKHSLRNAKYYSWQAKPKVPAHIPNFS